MLSSRLYRLVWLLLFISFSSTVSHAGTQPIKKLLLGAYDQIGKTLIYDGSYQRMDYPGGDVSIVRGVCSDVVIRALRRAEVDLQSLVHQDMRRNFSAYPQNWGLSRPDSNIDHRRVPNLMTYFKRQGKTVAVTNNPGDYLPGDFVSWVVPPHLPHIGIVSDQKSSDNDHYLIIHNIGLGARLDDILFAYPITGHVRFFEEDENQIRPR